MPSVLFLPALKCNGTSVPGEPIPFEASSVKWSSQGPIAAFRRWGGFPHRWWCLPGCTCPMARSFLGCTVRVRRAVNVGRAGAKSAVNTMEISIQRRECQKPGW